MSNIGEKIEQQIEKLERDRQEDRKGHPLFYQFCQEMIDLHDKKNADYRSEDNPFANFDRVVAIMQLYPKIDWAKLELVATIYKLKQFDAYLGMMEKQQEGEVEECDARLMDDSNYSVIARVLHKEGKNG